MAYQTEQIWVLFLQYFLVLAVERTKMWWIFQPSTNISADNGTDLACKSVWSFWNKCTLADSGFFLDC